MFMCHRRDLYYINITQFGQPCDLLTPQLRGVSYIGLWTLLSSSQSFAVIQFTCVSVFHFGEIRRRVWLQAY